MSYAKSKNVLPPMSEEAKEAAFKRAKAQKMQSLAEGILFNLCNGNRYPEKSPEELVQISVKMALIMTEAFYPEKETESEAKPEEEAKFM